MNRIPALLAVMLTAVLATLGGSNAWSQPGKNTQGFAAPTDPNELDLEIADALKVVLADILDGMGQDPCPRGEELLLDGKGLRCGIEYERPSIWTIGADKFKDTPFSLITVGKGRSYLLYNPRINGSMNLSDIISNRALVNGKTLRAANDRAELAQGRKAIEELKKRLLPQSSSLGGGYSWLR